MHPCHPPVTTHDPQSGSRYTAMAFNSVGKFTKEDTFGHFETQNESIHNAPKHRAVVGGGGR